MFVCFDLPENCSEHERKHDDGQSIGEHEREEDPVVGGGGVEDDEVDQDARDQGGARDEQGVDKEPGQPKGRVSQPNLTSLCIVVFITDDLIGIVVA